MQKASTVKILIYAAICVAIAFVLGRIKLFQMPQGGDVTACRMLFIALVGYWFGCRWGTIAGVAYGFLSIVLGAYVMHPVQMLLDYPLAYGAIGFMAGLFNKPKKLTSRYSLQLGYLLGAFGRFVCVFLSGFIFFGSYAPEGQHPVIYSLIYNGSYIAAEAALTLIIITIPTVKSIIERQKVVL